MVFFPGLTSLFKGVVERSPSFSEIPLCQHELRPPVGGTNNKQKKDGETGIGKRKMGPPWIAVLFKNVVSKILIHSAPCA